MKKLIITITLALGLGMGLNAQNDSFFTYNNYDTDRSSSWGAEAALPTVHGLTAHQSAEAPLGSGIVLLAGMALGYGIKRKIENVETRQQHNKK